ncbi:MAG: hypothetical protein JSU86_11950 [Phycisphaerales bacterium]|nr:MAG: hypothetical protein JSU86_11950 [Phycisphaerales bacterium]
MRTIAIIVMAVAPLSCNGCGTAVITEFPNAVSGTGGQPIVLEDIQAIVDNPNLADEEKRSQLRDLGIEDEELIEALLTL